MADQRQKKSEDEVWTGRIEEVEEQKRRIAAALWLKGWLKCGG
jgi:hypothetical protein